MTVSCRLPIGTRVSVHDDPLRIGVIQADNGQGRGYKVLFDDDCEPKTYLHGYLRKVELPTFKTGDKVRVEFDFVVKDVNTNGSVVTNNGFVYSTSWLRDHGAVITERRYIPAKGDHFTIGTSTVVRIALYVDDKIVLYTDKGNRDRSHVIITADFRRV